MERDMNQPKGLKGVHSAASSSPIQKIGMVLDHIVAALAEDSSCSLRRAQILVDIDAHPETTQTEVMDRLGIHKSAMNREIEWLYDHGCIKRRPGQQDGRVIHMVTYGYSRKNLDLALAYAGESHKNLQKFLQSLINMFTNSKPTLRDAKLMVSAADLGEVSRQELFARSYQAPSTTNVRALENLVEQGLIVAKTEE